MFLNGETKSSDNNHATAAIVQSLSDYTRSFEVDSSHMTVSSQVMSFESSRLAVDLGVILASSGVTFLDRSDSQV